MSVKCIRQHAMLFLFLGIVHSSEVEDYDFNIEHEKRTFDKHSATYCVIHIALCKGMCITAYVLLCKLWQQFSTVLDTCIVLSIFFSQLYVNKTKQQAVPIQALSFFTCTKHISISICVYTKLYQWCKIIMLIQNL